MDGDRRNAMQVAGAAVLGALCTSPGVGAQQPRKEERTGPVIALAGSTDEKEPKGFKVKQFGDDSNMNFRQRPDDEVGCDVTFDKELPRVPVVLVTSYRLGLILTVKSVSKSGFRVFSWVDGGRIPRHGDFSFIVVLP